DARGETSLSASARPDQSHEARIGEQGAELTQLGGAPHESRRKLREGGVDSRGGIARELVRSEARGERPAELPRAHRATGGILLERTMDDARERGGKIGTELLERNALPAVRARIRAERILSSGDAIEQYARGIQI